MTGINTSFAQLPTSPIKDPIAGCVVRFTPDLQSSEIVADGFRNAYDMDFNADGELFTYDSDNERCVSLPWYEPTRFYHVIPGGHHGWQSPQRGQWWRCPPYFPDIVAPVAELGRGSPTGVVCYRHVQFPEAYRGGMFLLDWTFGKVYFLPLKRAGATYTAEPQVFIEAAGDNGFAPTDIVVHPQTGDLFIAIGGRGTRGAVYRVRYPEGFKGSGGRKSPEPGPEAGSEADTQRVNTPRSPDRQQLLRAAQAPDALERLRALIAIHRHRAEFAADVIQQVVRANWDHPDRYVRKAASDLIATFSAKDRQALKDRAGTPQQRISYALAGVKDEAADDLLELKRLLEATTTEPATRLECMRLIQLALGDLMSPQVKGTVWEGYSARRGDHAKQAGPQVVAALRTAFPSGHAALDREISRTLAMLEDDDPALLERIAQRIDRSSEPIEDIHYLIVLARLRGIRSRALTERIANALLALDRKLDQRQAQRDRHWPLRLAEVHAELARKDPGLNNALLSHADFGRQEHALFTRAAGFDRRRAAELFLAHAKKVGDYPWTADLIELLASLPEEQALPVLRQQWENLGLRESILPLLARRPQPVDHAKFLEGLRSPQLATIRLCLLALEKLPVQDKPGQVLALIRALRSLSEGRQENELRDQIGSSLQQLTSQERLGVDKQAWTEWFVKAYPALAPKLGGVDGVDLDGWHQRLTTVDWSAGNAEQGQRVYTKAGCAACHSGAQALGPDLRGVTSRFSRQDLFTAILQPSRDVPPRYQTTLIATAEGKVYQGSVIYEAVDGLILQTGAATTVRLGGKQIAARRVTPMSLMPAGLLDKLSDQEIADLYAYLRSFNASAKNRRRRPPRSRRTFGTETAPCREKLDVVVVSRSTGHHEAQPESPQPIGRCGTS
jgi:putative heme-binding domain-containing protein